MREVCLGAHPVKHNSEAAHEIEASAASGKRPSEAAARPIFVTANFVTRLLFVTAPNASRAASKAAGDKVTHHRCHPRRFADPQDDSIFHRRTWHRAAGC